MITNEEIIKKYNESVSLIKQNNIIEARNILEDLISGIDTIQNETENERFYTFDNAIEFVSLIIFLKSEGLKSTKWVKNVYSKIYMEYSKILFDNEAFEKAKTIIEKAIKWNPMSAKNYFTKSNIFLKQNDLDNFYNINQVAGKISLSLKDISTYFSNLALYYQKIQKYELAIPLYVASLFYNKSEEAKKRLEHLLVKLENKYIEPEIDEAFRTLENNNIKILPNIELLTTLYDFANKEYENEKTNIYLIKQIYELLDSFLDTDDLKEKINKINKGVKGEEKKVLIISNNHFNNNKQSIENKITNKLQIKNQIIISSVNEVTKILISIAKEIHKTIYVRDIKEVLNQLMMNTERTFLIEYPNLDEDIQKSIHQYYNMDENAQREIMTEILFGFRKLRDDEIIE